MANSKNNRNNQNQTLTISIQLIIAASLLLASIVVGAPFVEDNVGSEQHLREWQRVIGPQDWYKLEQVNKVINRTHRRSDRDSRDFAMAKLFTLYKMGVPLTRLRIGYMRAHSLNQTINQLHTVLAYIAAPNAEPLILDNLDTRIRPLSLRRDLQSVYVFEVRGIRFSDKPVADRPAEKPQHRVQWDRVKWQNLISNLETVHY